MNGPPPKVEGTIADVLERRASGQPDALAYRFLPDGEGDSVTITYDALARRARTVAGVLAPQDRVLLFYGAGLDFVAAFLGCVSAGATAVPLAMQHLRASSPLLDEIASDTTPTTLLTTESRLAQVAAWVASSLYPRADAIRVVATDALTDVGTAPARVDPSWAAFLQYSSGSTRRPRGVVVSHANLVSNLAGLAARTNRSVASVGVSWLPHHHDMGLIDGVLQPLFSGYPTTLMSPLSFLQAPARWLRAISRYRGTTSGAPNFAYELCIQKVDHDALENGFDLGSWEMAYNGAEPVRPDTLRRFAATFRRWGLREGALYPCYGLAEATLIVTGGTIGEPPKTCTVRRDALERGYVAIADAAEPRTATLVDCGRSLDGQRVVVVDSGTRTACPDGRVGEIWVAGSSVALGYHGHPEDSEAVFRARLANGDGPFLRTGDLGFLRDGSLFVTGRLKDLLIVSGRNFYPQDIEYTAESAHPALRLGCNAAFEVDDPGASRSRIVLLQELRTRGDQREYSALIAAIRAAVLREHELYLDVVCLTPPGSVHKTSSGKVRRKACAAAFQAGSVSVYAESALDAAASPMERVLGLLVTAARSGTLDGDVRDLPIAALGVDSLAAAELLLRLRAELGVRLSLPELFATATLAELAERLANAPACDRRAEEIPMADDSDAQPLTPGALALWHLEQRAPSSGVLVNAMALAIEGPLDGDALERAFRAWLERHPVTRSVFRCDSEGAVVQRVLPALDAAFGRRDVGGRTPDQVLADARRLADESLDLVRGPLVRATLFTALRADGAREARSIFLVVAHHLVSDLASAGVLARELPVLYRQARGEGDGLPPPERGFFVYRAWLGALLAGEEGRAQRTYWAERLQGARWPELPPDRPRPPLHRYVGASVPVAIAPAARAAIVAAARAHGVTPFAAFLTVFQVFLARRADTSDVVIVVPVGAHRHPTWSNVVGYLANPVLVRTRFDDDPTFAVALRRTLVAVTEALENAEHPFTEAASLVDPSRDLRALPVAPALFAFEDDPTWSLDGTTRSVSIALPPSGIQFDLELVLRETVGGGLGGRLVYNADVFVEATAQRWARTFVDHVEAFAEAPRLAVSAVPVFDRPPNAWLGGPPTADGGAMDAHRLFEVAASRDPDALGISADGRRWTYGDVRRAARRLALHLRRLGVQAEDRVGLGLGCSAEHAIAALAILEVGAAFVPIDPAQPRARVRQIVEDGELRLTVTDRARAEVIAAAGSTPVVVEDVEERGETTLPRPTARGAAYVIYTSGSTGVPKGVILEHRGLGNLVAAQRAAFAVGPGARVSQLASVTFDASVFEIVMALGTGASLHVADEITRLGGAALADWLRRERITHLTATPSVLLATPSEDLHDLRVVVAAGEVCPLSVARRWSAGRRFFNAYGPTEATVWTTAAERGASDEARVPIGSPIHGVRVYLLDGHGRIAPVGAISEIHIGGAGVARGYHGRPARTAAAFRPDPFAGQPGARMFATGDYARYRADGAIEFLGRRDDQVKVAGVRAELGEIEAALRHLPSVKDCAVVLPAAPGGAPGTAADLVAYVVAATPPLDPAGLRAALRQSLPQPIVPGVIRVVDDLPRNTSGKVDRARLAELSVAVLTEGTRPPPVGPIEEKLAALWQEILVVPAASRDDHFFELGGTSFAAGRLVARAQQALHVALPLRAVFEHPVLRDLARVVGDRPRIEDGPPPVAFEVPGDDAPLSFAQQRMWFLHQADPTSERYHCAGIIRLRGPLSADQILDALDAVVRRHAGLRTRFVAGDAEPRQTIAPFAPRAGYDLTISDLRTRPADERADLLRARIEADARVPFALLESKALRAHLFVLTDDDHALGLVMHHIVSDGWSVGIILHDLGAACRREDAVLPELPLTYAELARRQRAAAAQGTGDEASLAYWQRTLHGAPELWAASPASGGGPVAERLPFALGSELSIAVRLLARRSGVTLFTVLLAALGATIHTLTGATDVVIGSDISGRDAPETEAIVGFFVNQVAVRFEVKADDEFGELIHRVWSAVSGALAHQSVPFEKVVRRLNPARLSLRMPLFQVKLVLQDRALPEIAIPGVTTEVSDVFAGAAQLDLLLNLVDTPTGTVGTWEYAVERFDLGLVRRWADMMRAFLAEGSQRPNTHISDVRPLVGGQTGAGPSTSPRGGQRRAVKIPWSSQ